MSTTPAPDASPTPPLFRALLDDAAVFPPGLAPVGVAVTDFLERREGPYAGLIGPLLIGTSAVPELVEVLAGVPPEPPIPVTVIARPGTPLAALPPALDRLGAAPVTVTGVELAHAPGWEDALGWSVPLAVEVSREQPARDAALAEIAVAAAAGHRVRAKLRTQSTPEQPLPTPEELAGFLVACASHGLPVKLTGGLHHAVPTETTGAEGAPEVQHGLLNVLLAVDLATAASDSTPASLAPVVDTLRLRDTETLVGRVRDLSEEAVTRVRERFPSYGCCGVLDPIHELADLGLLPR